MTLSSSGAGAEQLWTGGEDYDVQRVSRMIRLLRSYPHVTSEEYAELLHFICSGPRLEVELVSAPDGCEDLIAEFRRQHGLQISPEIDRALLVVMAVVGATLLAAAITVIYLLFG